MKILNVIILSLGFFAFSIISSAEEVQKGLPLDGVAKQEEVQKGLPLDGVAKQEEVQKGLPLDGVAKQKDPAKVKCIPRSIDNNSSNEKYILNNDGEFVPNPAYKAN